MDKKINNNGFDYVDLGLLSLQNMVYISNGEMSLGTHLVKLVRAKRIKHLIGVIISLA